MQLHRYPRCKIPGASQDDCCPFRTPPAVSALHHISCHRSQMSLDTHSRPSALVHSYMFVFTGTCLFSLICVCSHLYRFILPRIRFHVYAFVFTRTCSFSLVQVHLQLYMYARLILSGTRSF